MQLGSLNQAGRSAGNRHAARAHKQAGNKNRRT